MTNVRGERFHGGVDQSLQFELELGPKITAVIPQPVTRDPNNGLVLLQNRNEIIVEFNEDPLDPNSVSNRTFYRLTNTSDGSVQFPATVDFNDANNTATLIFAADIPAGTFHLRIRASDESNGTIDVAVVAGSIFQGSLHTTGYIGDDGSLALPANDVDLYSIEVPADGDLTVQVDPGDTLDPFLLLFNEAGTAISLGLAGSGDVVEIVNFPVTAGSYFVGVSSLGNIVYSPVDGSRHNWRPHHRRL